MILTICEECDSIVRTCFVKGSVKKDTSYKAYCKCTDILGRSEKRALKSFKKFNVTYERVI